MVETITPQLSNEALIKLAQEGRWHVLNTVAHSGAGHIGGPLSAMDMLIALYFDILRINPKQPQDPNRDRFILSKGHSAIGLYSVLALRGYFPVDELATFDHGDSRLQGHPDMKITPGIDASTGSLGQGLSAGCGMALSAKLKGQNFHTFVMIGDGELQEGMIWEALAFATRHKLDNLTAILDFNRLQQYGWANEAGRDRYDRSEPWGPFDLPTIFTGFGWNVVEIDGHDMHEIREKLHEVRQASGTGQKPTMVISHTAKGRGVSFTEGTYKWHNGVPTAEQLAIARVDLGLDENGVS